MAESTQTKPRVRLSAADRREQLLDAVKAVVDARGFHGASIEAIAQEAGISRPIVYQHFDDLPGALEAMLDRESARALGQFAEILPTDLADRDPIEGLLGGLRGYLEAVQADPITWRLVLMTPDGAPAMLRERIEAGRAAIVATLAEVVRPGLAPGLETPDPLLTARLLSTVADDAARLLLTDPGEFPPERLIAHARWMLERSLG
jgi:AcrR family transcriptional regulator